MGLLCRPSHSMATGFCQQGRKISLVHIAKGSLLHNVTHYTCHNGVLASHPCHVLSARSKSQVPPPLKIGGAFPGQEQGAFTLTFFKSFLKYHILRKVIWIIVVVKLQPSCLQQEGSSLVAQMVKHLPTMRETWDRSLGWEDPLEKEMANHSRALAWKTPWTEEPGRLQSMRLQRVGHD